MIAPQWFIVLFIEEFKRKLFISANISASLLFTSFVKLFPPNSEKKRFYKGNKAVYMNLKIKKISQLFHQVRKLQEASWKYRKFNTLSTWNYLRAVAWANTISHCDYFPYSFGKQFHDTMVIALYRFPNAILQYCPYLLMTSNSWAQDGDICLESEGELLEKYCDLKCHFAKNIRSKFKSEYEKRRDYKSDRNVFKLTTQQKKWLNFKTHLANGINPRWLKKCTYSSASYPIRTAQT